MAAHETDPAARRFALGRRQLGLLAGFAATALIGEVAARRLRLDFLEPYSNQVRATCLYAYATHAAPQDVVVIGSSRVAGGLDARIVQAELREAWGEPIEFYKLGVGGLRSRSLHEILRDVIVAAPPRELLVVAIEPRFFARPRRVDDAGVELEEIRGEWQVEAPSALERAFRGLKSLWSLEWVLRDSTRRALGFQQRNRGERFTVKQREQKESRKDEQEDFFDLDDGVEWVMDAADGEDRVQFRRALDVIDELACEVAFVRMPVVEGFDAAYMPRVFEQYEREVLGEVEARGHRYVDLNRPPYPRRPELFRGTTHLNRAGCVETSRAIVADLLVPLLRAAQRR